MSYYPSNGTTYWISDIPGAYYIHNYKFEASCCHFIEIIPIYKELDLNDYYTPSSAKEAMLYHYPLGTDIKNIIQDMKQLGFKEGMQSNKKSDHLLYPVFRIYGDKSGTMSDYFIGGTWDISLFHQSKTYELTYIAIAAKAHWPLNTYKFYKD